MNDMSNYPNLERYFNHFANAHGEPESRDCLPYLIVWIRLLVEPDDGERTDPTAFFEMDKEDTERFHCWGRNSRWKNVFWDFALNNLDKMKEKCIELANRQGDPDVEDCLKGCD